MHRSCDVALDVADKNKRLRERLPLLWLVMSMLSIHIWITLFGMSGLLGIDFDDTVWSYMAFSTERHDDRCIRLAELLRYEWSVGTARSWPWLSHLLSIFGVPSHETIVYLASLQVLPTGSSSIITSRQCALEISRSAEAYFKITRLILLNWLIVRATTRSTRKKKKMGGKAMGVAW